MSSRPSRPRTGTGCRALVVLEVDIGLGVEQRPHGVGPAGAVVATMHGRRPGGVARIDVGAVGERRRDRDDVAGCRRREEPLVDGPSAASPKRSGSPYDDEVDASGRRPGNALIAPVDLAGSRLAEFEPLARAGDGPRRVRLRRRRLVGRADPRRQHDEAWRRYGSGRGSSSMSRRSTRRPRCSGATVSMPRRRSRPMAVHGLAHPDGEVATARAAAAAGRAVHAVDDVERARSRRSRPRPRTADRWFQLYTQADPGRTPRARRAGRRRRLRRDHPDRRPAAARLSRARPPLTASQLPALGNFADVACRRMRPGSTPTDFDVLERPAPGRLTWADLAAIRSWSDLPLVLKGILTAEDAALAVEHGVDAIVVSNHGGRQLDRVAAADRRPRGGRRRPSTAGPRSGSTAASGAASTSRSPWRSAPGRCSSAGRSCGRSRRRRGRASPGPGDPARGVRDRAGAPRHADPGRRSPAAHVRPAILGTLRRMTVPLPPVDPALVETARPRSTSTPRRRATRELAATIDRANRLYHVEDAPEMQRRRVRPAVPRARRPRDRVPGADHRRLADPAGRWRPDRRRRSTRSAIGDRCSACRTRSATTSCGRSTRGCGAASACRAAPEPAPDLRYVAELKIDGLADHAALRARPVRPGRDPRRRHDRRGRDRRTCGRSRPSPTRLTEPATADVRGEVFMPKAEFARINAEREEAGLPLYANPRNSGAGSLRQKDPAVTASRLLSAWTYQLLEEGDGSLATQSGALDRLAALGLPGQPGPRGRPRHRGRHRLHRALARGAPRAAVRDRRRRRQGRPVRPAGAARHGQPGAALGDRLQVPAGAGRDRRRGHRPVRRADRDADAGRPPRPRSRSPARPSPGRRSTTSTRSAARTSASATASCSRRPATSSRRSSGRSSSGGPATSASS